MPDSEHIRKVASELDRRLGNQPFLTIQRVEATDLLRRYSGQGRTKLKRVLGANLDHALDDLGIRAFPAFEGTDTYTPIRLFRKVSAFARLMNLIEHPGADTDATLHQHLSRLSVRLVG